MLRNRITTRMLYNKNFPDLYDRLIVFGKFLTDDRFITNLFVGNFARLIVRSTIGPTANHDCQSFSKNLSFLCQVSLSIVIPIDHHRDCN